MIKKKAVAGGIVALAAVLGGGGIFAWTRRTADTETLADNQKYVDRKSTRLNSSHWNKSRMPSSA